MTAPFLPVPHNWIADPEHARRWPSAILSARNGAEQAIVQSLTPRESLRYTLTTTTPEQAAMLFGPVLAAAMASTTVARGQLRIPRWEDAVPLAVPSRVDVGIAETWADAH